MPIAFLLAGGKSFFADDFFVTCYLPTAMCKAVGKAFAICFRTFADCFWQSAKKGIPVVLPSHPDSLASILSMRDCTSTFAVSFETFYNGWIVSHRLPSLLLKNFFFDLICRRVITSLYKVLSNPNPYQWDTGGWNPKKIFKKTYEDFLSNYST